MKGMEEPYVHVAEGKSQSEKASAVQFPLEDTWERWHAGDRGGSVVARVWGRGGEWGTRGRKTG